MRCALVHRQPQEALDRKAVVGYHFGLSLGELVDIGHSQELQDHSRVVGRRRLALFASVDPDQSLDEALLGD